MRKKKNKMKYNWFNMSNEQREKWEKICPPNKYRVIKPEDLIGLGPLPTALIKKYDSIVIIASGVPNMHIVYYMLLGNRVDVPDKSIDQMPFGFAFIGETPLPSGCLIQHASYEGRTQKPPPEFWEYIQQSGIGQCYPLSQLPEKPCGNITEIKNKSYHSAFNLLVKKLKNFVD